MLSTEIKSLHVVFSSLANEALVLDTEKRKIGFTVHLKKQNKTEQLRLK